MIHKILPNEPNDKDDEANGVWEDYDENGQLEFKDIYKNDKLIDII